jgi:hypothetical protein
MVILKDCQNKMQQLQKMEQGKEYDHTKDGGKRLKRI